MQILDKDYYKEIIKFVHDNFINNEVIIFSNLSNSYLINLYRNAKLYLFSSYCEVFGLTSLEAMSQNCPVILSNKSSLNIFIAACAFKCKNSASYPRVSFM